MPRLTVSDRISIDRARIERGKATMQPFIDKYKKNIKYYIGDQWDDLTIGPNENQLTINKIFPTVRTQLPALLFSDPHYNVASDRSDTDDKQSDAKENGVNFFFQKAEGGFAARMSVMSAMFGFGCIKVGYTPTFMENPNRGVFKQDEEGSLDMITKKIRGRDVEIPKLSQGDYMKDGDGQILMGNDGLPILEPPDLMVDEDFFIRWLPVDSCIFDPEGNNDFRTHRWFIEEWVRSTEDVKADILLKNTRGLEPTEMVKDPQFETTQPMGVQVDEFVNNPAVKSDEGRTRGWTIYDWVKREVRVLVDGGSNARDRYVRQDVMAPELLARGPKHGGPYAFNILNEIPGQWLPMTDIEPLIPLQDEMNMQRSKISTHLRRADRKYLADEGFISDQEQWDALEGGGDMTIATVDDKDAIRALEQMPIDSAIFTALPDTNSDFDEIGGAGEIRGVARSETATQGAIIENRQKLRESDRRDTIIRKHLIDVGSKLLSSIQRNLMFSQHARIEDPKHRQPYLWQGTINPRDLDGDFAVSIDVSSIQPRTNPVYRQQVLSLLQNIIVPMIGNPVAVQFLTPQLMDELFEIFEIGNTEIADQLGEIANQIAVQAQTQAQSPDSATGAAGALAGQLSGQANPLAGLSVAG